MTGRCSSDLEASKTVRTPLKRVRLPHRSFIRCILPKNWVWRLGDRAETLKQLTSLNPSQVNKWVERLQLLFSGRAWSSEPMAPSSLCLSNLLWCPGLHALLTTPESYPWGQWVQLLGRTPAAHLPAHFHGLSRPSFLLQLRPHSEDLPSSPSSHTKSCMCVWPLFFLFRNLFSKNNL